MIKYEYLLNFDIQKHFELCVHKATGATAIKKIEKKKFLHKIWSTMEPRQRA
jgi:hypothetical protein